MTAARGRVLAVAAMAAALPAATLAGRHREKTDGGGPAAASGVAAPGASGRVLELNGVRLQVSTGVSDRSVAQLASDYAAACRRGSGGLEVVRAQDPQRAQLSCPGSGLDPDGARSNPAAPETGGGGALVQALLRLVGEGAVAPALDYLVLERRGGRTHHLRLRLDPSQSRGGLGDVVALAGDAPAGAAAEPALAVPRPPGARRLLAFAELGQPYAVAVYHDPLVPPEASARQQRALGLAQGFRVHTPTAAAEEEPAWNGQGGQRRRQLFRRGDLWALVVSRPDRAGLGTTTTVAATRGPGASPNLAGAVALARAADTDREDSP